MFVSIYEAFMLDINTVQRVQCLYEC